MMGPLLKQGVFGIEFSFVLAFVTGIGFGFVLERAGFGSSRKLAAQFYFRDMTVFKVMFSAIVTAMLGLYYLDLFALIDLEKVYVNPTVLGPQVVGGLILGFGFIIGGYCPGTSLVALATGKIDAMIFGLGLIVGMFIFGETYSMLGDFTQTGAMGRVLLPEWLGVKPGVVILAVVLIAVAGFKGAEIAERYFSRENAQ